MIEELHLFSENKPLFESEILNLQNMRIGSKRAIVYIEKKVGYVHFTLIICIVILRLG